MVDARGFTTPRPSAPTPTTFLVPKLPLGNALPGSSRFPTISSCSIAALAMGAGFWATNTINKALTHYLVASHGADLALAEVVEASSMLDQITIDSPVALFVVFLASNASPLTSCAGSRPGMRRSRPEISYSWP
uniref:Uncharacterized protein n=1 Tax=Candidatus Kentrum sp. DK TaxID=2126562 RepID=A0A450S0F4_9GAMM|nr:MAG: hypothetical protein BECKDK2373C_GA0170839_101041 [Candidatus Kentron sp. DK]